MLYLTCQFIAVYLRFHHFSGSKLAHEFLERHHADKGINCSTFPSVFVQLGGLENIRHKVEKK